jgi:hypothetical protein
MKNDTIISIQYSCIFLLMIGALSFFKLYWALKKHKSEHYYEASPYNIHLNQQVYKANVYPTYDPDIKFYSSVNCRFKIRPSY